MLGHACWISSNVSYRILSVVTRSLGKQCQVWSMMNDTPCPVNIATIPDTSPTLLFTNPIIQTYTIYPDIFNWINQPDAANSQVYYLSFKYSSTCFRHPHAHHQELQQLQQQPLVYRRNVVVAVLLAAVGPTGPTTANSTATTKLRR